ncbi:MAG TPA: hypothetical protein ENN38_04550 [Actinobacteria bacterium]|nr:hypothetical protein [Actinomycetota bacterium]
MRKKTLKYSLCCLILVLFFCVYMSRIAYCGEAKELITNTTKVSPGETIRVSGDNLTPGTEIKVYIHSNYGIFLGTGIVDPRGYFSLSITIPPDISVGEHIIRAVEKECVFTKTIIVTRETSTPIYLKAPILISTFFGTAFYIVGAILLLKNRKERRL